MEKNKKIKIWKIIVAILASALIIGIIVYLIPLIMNISTAEGRILFKEKIDSLGIYGILALTGVQLAQILLIVLPRRTSRNTCWNVLWSYWWSNIYYYYSIYNYNNNSIFSETIWKEIYI